MLVTRGALLSASSRPRHRVVNTLGIESRYLTVDISFISSGLRVVCKKVYCQLECTLNKISLSSWVAQAPRSLTMAVNIASCQHFYWHNCNTVFFISYPREVDRAGYCRKQPPSNSKGFFCNKKCTFPSRQTVFKWMEVQYRRQKGDPDLKVCSSF